MKNTTKQLQKRTVFIFRNVNGSNVSNTSDTTTSTDPTTALTTTVTTDALQNCGPFSFR